MDVIAPIVIVLATSAIIVSRLPLVAAVSVGAIYVLVGVLLRVGVSYPVALAYVAAGLASAAVIWLPEVPRRRDVDATPRRVTERAEELGSGSHSMSSPPLGWFFTTTTLLFLTIAAYGLASTYPLREVRLASGWESFVAYWLLIAGSLSACTTRSPFRSGLGLLLLLCGSSVVYILVTESFRFTIVLVLLLLSILLTLVISHLANARIAEMPPEVQAE